MIIATSDHGMPFPRVKGQIYDDGFHVPMAARWGNKIKPGRVVTDFVTFPDLAPTLLEIAGVPADEQFTGESFVQQLLVGQTRDASMPSETTRCWAKSDTTSVEPTEICCRLAIRLAPFATIVSCTCEISSPIDGREAIPEFGLLNCDGSPTKSFLTNLSMGDDDYRFYEMSFGKRPAEELYDIRTGPRLRQQLGQGQSLRGNETAALGAASR